MTFEVTDQDTTADVVLYRSYNATLDGGPTFSVMTEGWVNPFTGAEFLALCDAFAQLVRSAAATKQGSSFSLRRHLILKDNEDETVL
jgi:hypothetical protein